MPPTRLTAAGYTEATGLGDGSANGGWHTAGAFALGVATAEVLNAKNGSAFGRGRTPARGDSAEPAERLDGRAKLSATPRERVLDVWRNLGINLP